MINQIIHKYLAARGIHWLGEPDEETAKIVCRLYLHGDYLCEYPSNCYIYLAWYFLDKNCRMTRHYYKLAWSVNKNNIWASYGLAEHYLSRNKIIKACQWVEYAENIDKIFTYCNLAIFFDRIGNPNASIKFKKLAAKTGDIESANAVAKYYQDKHDKYQAIKYFLLLVKNLNKSSSNPETIKISKGNAYLKIATIYTQLEMLGKSLTFYKKAATCDCMNAILFLARYYATTGNSNLSMKYYHLAVEKGSIRAMMILGEVYVRVKNYNEAFRYGYMAAQKGDTYAMIFLAKLFHSKKNYTEAIIYLNMAVKKGCAYSFTCLGNIYFCLEEYDKMISAYEEAYKYRCEYLVENLKIITESRQSDRLCASHLNALVNLLEKAKKNS